MLKTPIFRFSVSNISIFRTRFDQWPAVDKKKWREGAVVKGRNEPHNIRQVLEIIAAVREVDNIEQLADKIYTNTEKLFFAKTLG